MSEIRTRAEPIYDLGSGRDDFDRDYTAILYSHAFQRLKHKTQVVFYAESEHVCTRLNHSLYVAAISEIVCKNFLLNGIQCDPALAKTIGIGHDIGHPPFGHAGEEVLNELAADIGGFRHETHGLRIVDKIEKPRNKTPLIGLNLTEQVRDGIVNHCGEISSTTISPSKSRNLDGKSHPFTIEGCVVKLVDKIAYLGRDLEDAYEIRSIGEADVPEKISEIIGSKNGEIVDYFVGDLIETSTKDRVALSEKASGLMNELYQFNVQRIYKHAILERFKRRVKDILEILFHRFVSILKQYGNEVKRYYQDEIEITAIFKTYVTSRTLLYFVEESELHGNNDNLYKRIVIDFLSTLSDHFVFKAVKDFYLPKLILFS